MSKKLPISVFIIAVNEGDRIAHSIASVIDWVDEVIVIDSGSTDNTVQASGAAGARVVYNPWPGYGLQKRFGEDQCRNDWILNIDADEVVSENLRIEIKELFASAAFSHQGWKIPIVEILPGRKRPALFAHKIVAIRLYNKEYGRFSDSTVHDTVRMERGSVGQLKGIIDHRSSRGLTHSMDKINRYSTMQAANLKNSKGLQFPIFRLITEFPLNFLKAYLLRGYIFAGRQGFVNAVLYGYSRFIRIAKYLEL